MNLKTVFVTNRNINEGKTRKKKLFGDKPDKEGTVHFASAERKDKKTVVRHRARGRAERPRTTIKKTYDLSLIDSSNVENYLAEIVRDSGNGRPWVFFLHGNNQTLSKNLVKSRLIQDEYNVNMVVFSWPSRSYDPKTVPVLLLAGLLSANPSTELIGKWVAKKAFKKKVKQYKRARECAEKSVVSFNSAFKTVRDQLLKPIKNTYGTHSSFLVHSLGHLLLKKAAIESSPLFENSYVFDQCMLHQADELDENHRQWISEIAIVNNDNTHITRNKKDIVLLLSGVVNSNFDLAKAYTRLGNRQNRDSEQGSPLKYIDFTGLDEVGIGHGIAWDMGRSRAVDNLCRPILTGEPVS